jgi:LacI family transcriptional regulator
VRPATRERVLQAAAELGYRTPRGRSVATTVRGVLGFVVSETSYAHFAEVVHGVETAARERGYSMLLSRSHEDADLERRAVETFIAHRVNGVVISPTAGWDESVLPLLREAGIPFVLLDRERTARCDQVLTENMQTSRALVEHLIDRGHERIAMLSGAPGLSTTEERVRGYRNALAQRGIELRDDLLVVGGSSTRGGRLGVRQLLARPEPPTAIFCGNDAMTVGALLALREAGRRVPDDVAIVAFDDFEWYEAFDPQVTAAIQPAYAVGERGARMVIDRISDPYAPPQVVRMPTEVAHRTSCGC